MSIFCVKRLLNSFVTDGRTDGPTDRKVAYRVAYHATKKVEHVSGRDPVTLQNRISPCRERNSKVAHANHEASDSLVLIEAESRINSNPALISTYKLSRSKPFFLFHVHR